MQFMSQVLPSELPATAWRCASLFGPNHDAVVAVVPLSKYSAPLTRRFLLNVGYFECCHVCLWSVCVAGCPASQKTRQDKGHMRCSHHVCNSSENWRQCGRTASLEESHGSNHSACSTATLAVVCSYQLPFRFLRTNKSARVFARCRQSCALETPCYADAQAPFSRRYHPAAYPEQGKEIIRRSWHKA